MSACARVTSLPLMADCFDIDELPDEPAIAEDLRVALAGGAKNVREVLDKVPSTRRLVLIAIFRCLGAHKEVYRKGDSLPRVEHDYKRLPYPISSDFFYVTRDGVCGTKPEEAARDEAA